MSPFFFILFFLLPHSLFSIITNTTVTIPGLGSFQGLSSDTYESFLRIPYAQPPTGDLRWMPPVSPANWSDLYDSLDYPAACPQPPSSVKWTKKNMTFSEDCLFLSIWKPKIIPDSGAAVLVWLHGGSYLHGGAAQTDHNGQFLAENQSVIVVVVQYRLGLLGFGALPLLKSLNPYHTTGTYGVLDQIAALKWVNNYISAFGGDPNRITLGGFSAGATSACLLSIIPQSKGLFSQGIWHSNACWLMTKNPTEAYANSQVLQNFCNLKAASSDVLKCLRGLDVNNITNVSIEIENIMIDGYLLNEHSFLTYKDQVADQKNSQLSAVLLGNVINEGTIFMPPNVTKENYPSCVSGYTQWLRLNSTILGQVLTTYPCSNETDCNEPLEEVFGDSELICNEVLIAQWLAQTKTQVFAYAFSHAPSSEATPFLGAYHGSDIPFAFHNVEESLLNSTAEELALSDAMVDTWGKFINNDYSDLTSFNSSNNYARINLTTPVTLPYPIINNWKSDVCTNIWLPAYTSALNELVKNDTVKNYNKTNLTIPELGTIQGLDGDGYEAYLKIPYAEPPLNDLRWNSPVSPRSWNGTLDATNFPDPCPQIISDFFGNVQSLTEDCLYLSVWKPKNQVIGGNPVVVWIHGGALWFGSINDPDYNGEYMARNESIVFISIQYRLGVLGFLGIPELKGENPDKTTGNYGLLDQIAALKWVQNYVSAFGGDPQRITVAGESAGASSILFHLSIPNSNGLFKQAIVESNSAFVEILSPTQKYNISRELISGLCNISSDSSTLLSCLRSLDVAQLLALDANDVSKATLDGYLLEEHPYSYFRNWASRPHHNISAIFMGNNLNEGTAFLTGSVNSSNYNQVIKQDSPWIPDEDILNLTKNLYPCPSITTDCSLTYAELLGDVWLNCPSILPAQTIANDPSVKIFSYLFSHPPESTARYIPFFGAYHGSEIAFAFHNVPSARDFYTSQELALSNSMAQIWAKFIREDYSGFSPYSNQTKYLRFNFSTPVTTSFETISGWKEDVCDNVWEPIYHKVDRLFVNNQSQPDDQINGTVLLTITDQGVLKGQNSSDYEAYLKVPYAQPPVNNLRFMPPEENWNWTDVYDSTEYPSACPQKNTGVFWMENVTFDEDCLYLSIWKPKNNASNSVVVWFTGTYETGGAKQFSHKGQYMAQNESTVFVLVQYRLGILGFLGLKELKENNSLNSTGNYGLLDQIEALKWVKAHISAFGGDPNRITIGGFWQGAASVCLHLIMPQSQNLFNQTILHSFECFNDIRTQEVAFTDYRKVVALKCDVNASVEVLLNCIRTLDVDTIVNAPIENIGPMIDGYLLKEHPFITYKNLSERNTKLNVSAILMGNNANEGTSFFTPPISLFDYPLAILKYNSWANSLDLLKGLLNYTCESVDCSDSLAEMITDANFICHSTLVSQWISNSSSKPNIYSFLFPHATETYTVQYPNLKAFLSGDIPYVWHNVPTSYEYYTQDESILSGSLAKTWGKFARGDFSDLTKYNSENQFKRMNFSIGVDLPPYNLTEENWKQSICNNVWLLAYQNSFGALINNDTNKNGSSGANDGWQLRIKCTLLMIVIILVMILTN